MANITNAQREQAVLHATVWEKVSFQCKRSAASLKDVSDAARYVLTNYGSFAQIVGNEYRRVINDGKVEE